MSTKESFYIPAGDFCASEEGKKPQKLLMIPGGSFGGSAAAVVGVWRVVNPRLCCISLHQQVF